MISRRREADEELRHLYTLAPSSELLASYGFVPEGGARGFEEAVVEPRCVMGP